MGKIGDFLKEARRRQLFRVAALYVVAVWIILQVADVLFPAWEIPEAAKRYVLIGAFLGFPLALIFGWYYDVTAQGIARTIPARPGQDIDLSLQRSDYLILAAFVLVAGAVIYGLFARILQVPADSGSVAARRPMVEKAIAVLPFENRSPDPENAYFADGVHDDLLMQLSRVGDLKVISRTSVERFRNTERTIPEIGRQLGVAHVLEGAVQQVADQVHINVQLIDARSDHHVWAASYERNLQEVLLLQGEIARTIAEEIQVGLTPDEETRLQSVRRIDPQTYQDYVRGMFHLYKFTPAGFERGLTYMQRAMDRDPTDPLAYAGLALVYSLASSHSPTPPPEAFDARARFAASRALELDDTVAEAHAALGQIKLYREWDWAGAEQAFLRALQLNANLAPAHGHYAMYLNLVGRQSEALAAMRRAVEIDPLTAVWTTWLGDLHWVVGDYDRAIEQFQSSLELDPDFPWTYYMLGLSYCGKGMYDEAIAAHERATALNPGFEWALAYSYARAGRTDEAREIAAKMAEAPRPYAWGLAEISTALGEKDEAIRWLEAAYEDRYAFVPWLKLPPPTFEPLRGDPRFEDLVQQLEIPDQAMPAAADAPADQQSAGDPR